MAVSSLTAKRLREILEYDPVTGIFRRRSSGKRVGTINRALGYRLISVDDVRHYEHRLAWLYVYGRWPKVQMDHINRNRADNRLDNLREANHSESLCNQRVRKDSKSGFRGVVWNSQNGKWKAVVQKDGKRYFAGFFTDASTASKARDAAAKRLHGEFVFFNR